MRKSLFFIAILSLLALQSTAIPFTEKDLETEESFKDLFERWLSHHELTRDLTEKIKRFNVFKENVLFIHEHNKKGKRYELALNKFGDMTQEEFHSFYAGSKIAHHRSLRGEAFTSSFMHGKMESVPSSVDWRQKGAVAAVKDQGQCGSCWTFSTTASVEGINFIKTGELIALSEQQLIDCDKGENNGCNGGLMDYAFEYIKQNGGITSESAYPYTAADGTCGNPAPVVMIDGYEDVPRNNEVALMKAVASQPVSVAIDASGKAFQFYSKGVFTGSCSTNLDHGVAVVGYGATSDGKKYWIVRNSWGASWGEEGYIKMEREIKAKQGKCGIAMEASYPVKTSPNPTIEMNDEL